MSFLVIVLLAIMEPYILRYLLSEMMFHQTSAISKVSEPNKHRALFRTAAAIDHATPRKEMQQFTMVLKTGMQFHGYPKTPHLGGTSRTVGP
ncbi:unnamed protein product [Enterobius vermicularis]|uniref:Secreted protein n=1 Tax=Enterobius vermicularis TaxID=51028 RepID=A0A0N4UYY0_ENTVE|nr:unnamed protein product [Enterobius vermicularis]